MPEPRSASSRSQKRLTPEYAAIEALSDPPSILQSSSILRQRTAGEIHSNMPTETSRIFRTPCHNGPYAAHTQRSHLARPPPPARRPGQRPDTAACREQSDLGVNMATARPPRVARSFYLMKQAKLQCSIDSFNTYWKFSCLLRCLFRPLSTQTPAVNFI